MHGGMLFASRLSLMLGIDLEFDYLHATRYRGAIVGSGLAWMHRPATPLEGRRVLIVDDILDEGHTLKAVRNWCEDQGATDVRIAVLCVKNHDRRVAGHRRRLHRARSAGPLRLRLRHGLPRARPQPAGDLRACAH